MLEPTYGGLSALLCQALESDQVKQALITELNKLIDLPLLTEDLERKLISVLVEVLMHHVKLALKCEGLTR